MIQSANDNPRDERTTPRPPQTPRTVPRTVPRWRLLLAVALILAALVHLLLAPWTGWAIGTAILAAIAARLLVMRGVAPGGRH